MAAEFKPLLDALEKWRAEVFRMMAADYRCRMPDAVRGVLVEYDKLFPPRPERREHHFQRRSDLTPRSGRRAGNERRGSK